MGDDAKIDFGPLEELIGLWQGDKGTDIAPEPDGTEISPYFETITLRWSQKIGQLVKVYSTV
jgi:hypothetical protein